MKIIQFLVDFFAVDGSGNRFVKYRQGQAYPCDEETQGQVVAGNAREIETEEVAAPKGQIPLDVPAPEASVPETSLAQLETAHGGSEEAASSSADASTVSETGQTSEVA